MEEGYVHRLEKYSMYNVTHLVSEAVRSMYASPCNDKVDHLKGDTRPISRAK